MSPRTLRTECTLIVAPKRAGAFNDDLQVRVAKRLGRLAAGEVPIKLHLAVPATLFSRPQLQAAVTVPEESVCAPVIDAQVLDNIAEALQQELGVDLSIQLITPEDRD